MDLSLLGFAVIVAGIVVLLIATLLAGRTSGKDRAQHSEVKGAGVIMIGPIPIIFGNDSRLVVVAIVLAIVLVALALVAGFW